MAGQEGPDLRRDPAHVEAAGMEGSGGGLAAAVPRGRRVSWWRGEGRPLRPGRAAPAALCVHCWFRACLTCPTSTTASRWGTAPAAPRQQAPSGQARRLRQPAAPAAEERRGRGEGAVPPQTVHPSLACLPCPPRQQIRAGRPLRVQPCRQPSAPGSAGNAPCHMRPVYYHHPTSPHARGLCKLPAICGNSLSLANATAHRVGCYPRSGS